MRGEATIVLEPKASSILAFERFADGLGFLAEDERRRLKLAGEEILDNLVKHASPLEGNRIVARAARRDSRDGNGRRETLLLAFYFRSPSFGAFVGKGVSPAPFYDPEHRRWRGIGLVMCRNLARRLSFRPGERMDRVFLEF